MGHDFLIGSGACSVFVACFAMVLLCPQTTCFHMGACCRCLAMTFFVVVPMLVSFVGGMGLNTFNPMYRTLEWQHGKCLAAPCFGVYCGMNFMLLGPVHAYMRMWLRPDLRHVPLCDWSRWRSSRGVYFADGELRSGGPAVILNKSSAVRSGEGWFTSVAHWDLDSDMPRVLSSMASAPDTPRAAFHLVPHCRWREKRWYGCVVGLRPVLADGRPCAWAIDLGKEPELQTCGHFGSGGVCGLPTDFQSLVGSCGGPANPQCEQGISELVTGIQGAAERLGVPYVSEVPLLELRSPFEAAEGDLKYVIAAIVLGLLYVPLPICLFLVTSKASKFRARQRLSAQQDTFSAELPTVDMKATPVNSIADPSKETQPVA